MERKIEIGFSGSMEEYSTENVEDAIKKYADNNDIEVKDVLNDPHIKVKEKRE